MGRAASLNREDRELIRISHVRMRFLYMDLSFDGYHDTAIRFGRLFTSPGVSRVHDFLYRNHSMW